MLYRGLTLSRSMLRKHGYEQVYPKSITFPTIALCSGRRVQLTRTEYSKRNQNSNQRNNWQISLAGVYASITYTHRYDPLICVFKYLRIY